MFLKVLSFFLWLEIALLTIFWTVLICLLLPFHLFDPRRRLAHKLCTLWGKSIFLLNPLWKIEIKGREHLRDGQTYVFVSNHGSLADIIFIYHLDAPFKWVAKESLFKIPFLGWSMALARYVRLKRGAHSSIRDSFKASQAWLEKNESMLIFPEGTRSETGELGPFKVGAFKLAAETKTPILPMVMVGPRDVLVKNTLTMNPRVLCTLSILPEIPPPPDEKAAIQAVQDECRSRISAELARLKTR